MSAHSYLAPTAIRRLKACSLTAEAFRPYGEVIDGLGTPTQIANGGAASLHRDLADIDVGGGHVCVSWARTTPTALPIQVKVMERHRLGSQAFVPLDGAQMLLVVAPPGKLDPAAIVAFLAAPSQGINFRCGVWHHPLIALHRTSDFVIIDRAGEGDNLELLTLSEPLAIDMP